MNPIAPPDQPSRDAILGELDTTFLVEAAAGTGKTTCMVGRMIALIRQGRCPVENLAAVTFTRKAGAELRTRFQAAMEQAAAQAMGQARDRLAKALAHIERCFVGTIHSFCARLLRERPVEAGVDLAFEEIDEVADADLRQEAWSQYVDRLYAENNPLLLRLHDAGLQVNDLAGTFHQLAQYPDVADWPREPAALPDTAKLAAMLLEYARHMRELLPTFPADYGANKIMPRFRTLERAIRHADLTQPAQLMGVLEQFGGEVKSLHRNWPGGKDQAAAEHERWNDYISRYVAPTLTLWRQHRYAIAMDAIFPAVEVYNRLRQTRAALNFQDLLLRAAALLRDKPSIRRYFRRRFTHVLVDEFQDTDPIQAEVMLLLTADDAAQADWRKCRPAAGSLFVVGDPKQSIYRFRRADIVTYNQVRRIIEGCGRIVPLTANFRCQGPIIDFVNAKFGEVFNNQPEDRDDVPRNVPLEKGLPPAAGAGLLGVHTLRVPEEFGNKDAALEYDADFIARFIRTALDDGLTVARPPRQLDAGTSPKVAAGDFMILSYRKANMQACARRLQELGIPCEITGGSTLNQVGELELLHRCLQALLQPDNPIALVAVLRGELFGFSDPWLFAFTQAGGQFNFRHAVPGNAAGASRPRQGPQDQGRDAPGKGPQSRCTGIGGPTHGQDAHATFNALEDGIRQAFVEAFDRLKRYALWLSRLPAAAAIERIAQDLGLLMRAGAREGGDVQCGSLAKALELLRAAQAGAWTAAELADFLGEIVAGSASFDGISARPPQEAPVRIMNLHKAKGLEAPVVLLACPAGQPKADVQIHVDRRGETAHGYLRVLGPRRGTYGKAPVLAEPVGWERFEAREQAFLDAEQDRLRYVAATRAGSALVISQREKRNSANFWAFFEDADLPVLASGVDVPPASGADILSASSVGVPPASGADILSASSVGVPPAHLGSRVSDPAVTAGQRPAANSAGKMPAERKAETPSPQPEAAIAARWETIRQPSSELASGKRTAGSHPGMQGPDALATPDGGEHGTEWGTAIHALLEALAANPDADLAGLAASVLADNEIPRDRLGDAVETARAVVRSDLWARAMRSPQRLAEVPFFLHEPPGEAHALPRIVRGVIDLVFREEGGWVIVDYKTDAAAAASPADLVRYYQPQLAAYTQAWQTLTGQPVKETGLFFTKINRYVGVP